MASLPKTQSQITLINRPQGAINPDLNSGKGTFKLNKQAPVVQPLENQVVVQVEYCSLDPAMRGWLNDSRSYIAPVQIDEVMRAGAVGKIVALGSGVKDYKLGDYVYGQLGWQEYCTVRTKDIEKLNTSSGINPSVFLGAAGMPGKTAYFGVFDILKVKAGELVVVSGAAGAVGTVVVSICKLMGCKVIAIAGGADKCAWLKSEFKVDAAVDYKAKDFRTQFKTALEQNGKYVNCYFDNVGGEILDLVLTRLQKNARIAICGAISAYNDPNPKGINQYLNLISQRAKIEGFIVFDYADRYAEAEEYLTSKIKEGSLIVKETELQGLDKAVEGLMGLFEGANLGKLIVKINTSGDKGVAKL